MAYLLDREVRSAGSCLLSRVGPSTRLLPATAAVLPLVEPVCCCEACCSRKYLLRWLTGHTVGRVTPILTVSGIGIS